MRLATKLKNTKLHLNLVTSLFLNTNSCTVVQNFLDEVQSLKIRDTLKRQSIWWAAPPTSCITTNSTNQSSASCISMVTERRWRQWGGKKGKQSRGGWGRWEGRGGGERERQNRYLLLFHREDLKSEASSWSGGRAGEDWLTADGSQCRDGVEGCLGCWSLWDLDLQWPLSLCSVDVVRCFLLWGKHLFFLTCTCKIMPSVAGLNMCVWAGWINMDACLLDCGSH